MPMKSTEYSRTYLVHCTALAHFIPLVIGGEGVKKSGFRWDVLSGWPLSEVQTRSVQIWLMAKLKAHRIADENRRSIM